MGGDYTKLPTKAKVNPAPFEAHISDQKLSQMKQLIELGPIGPDVWENQQQDRSWGMTRKWLQGAKEYWTTQYDWRASEKRINSYPNYTVPITDRHGKEYVIHFIALFSEKEDAIPIGFFHGWPGSILEFLGMLDLIKHKYSAKYLPYHIIVPSLPGYAFSSGPPADQDLSIADVPYITHGLMEALGFGDGYVTQGGDIGSFVAKHMADEFDACKAYHLNMGLVFDGVEDADKLDIHPWEAKAKPRGDDWLANGCAYGNEHGTRTATIGLVLSSSPIAMLAWIGEKFLEWTDTDPRLDDVLDSVSLYWLTDTFPRCIYPYRRFNGPAEGRVSPALEVGSPNRKPFGFSWYPKELVPTPIALIKTTGNLVHYNRHETGGHFAAFEDPAGLFGDVEEFVKVAWKA